MEVTADTRRQVIKKSQARLGNVQTGRLPVRYPVSQMFQI